MMVVWGWNMLLTNKCASEYFSVTFFLGRLNQGESKDDYISHGKEIKNKL